MNIRRLLFAAALGLLAVAQPASAQLLTYTASGGRISGSLNGVGFTAALWEITVTADSSQAQFYPAGSSGAIWVDTWALPVTPTLTITTEETVLTATLPGWDIEYRDYFNAFGADSDIMFANSFADGHDGVAEGNAAYISVSSGDTFEGLTVTGSFYGNSNFDRPPAGYSTSAGTLFITASDSIPGSFVIAAVPEPSAAAAFIGVGAFALAMARRRPRRACS